MFEQSVVPRGPASKRIWTTGIGMTGEAILLVIAILVPIVSPEILPRHALQSWLLPVPPVPPPRAHVAPHTSGTMVRISQIRGSQLFLPVSAPAKPQIFVDEPPEYSTQGVPDGVEGGVPGGVPHGLMQDILKDTLRPAPYARPPEPRPAATKAPEAEPARRIRISSIEQAEPIFRPEPQYPSLARQARVSGVVQLMGVIGVDGRIKELKVLSGHPLLVKAAYDAVHQWIYKPTLLNGRPVEVEAPITVNFRLQ